MSETIQRQALPEGDEASDQAYLDLQSYLSTQDDFLGEPWLADWNADQIFDRSYAGSYAGSDQWQSEAPRQDLLHQYQVYLRSASD